ncbi:hypothetical protein CLOM_g1657 [Closterium sp. NIES-68]|nr:hypothetical protein CLOM_g1657 [Closterium sp. NIES-68]GJP86159.1 hypothetical protein CLOP_g16219 [Closterium sp. NIES-67]
MARGYLQPRGRAVGNIKASLLFSWIILLLTPHPERSNRPLHFTVLSGSGNGFILSGASHAASGIDSAKPRRTRVLRPDSAPRLPLRAQPAGSTAPGAPQMLAPLLRFRPQPAESVEPGSTRRTRWRKDRREQAQYEEQKDKRDERDEREQREQRERTGAAAALEVQLQGSSMEVLPLDDLIRAPRGAQQLQWQQAQQRQAADVASSPGMCPDFQPWSFFAPNPPSPHIHACSWRPMSDGNTSTVTVAVSKRGNSAGTDSSGDSNAVLTGLSEFMRRFLADRESGAHGSSSRAVQQDCRHWKWLWPRPLVTRGELCLDEDEVRGFVIESMQKEQMQQAQALLKDKKRRLGIQGLQGQEGSMEEVLEPDPGEVFKRTQEAINSILAARQERVVSSSSGGQEEEEEEEGMGVIGQGGVVMLRDVFVDGRGAVFNATHVLALHGACTRGGGRKRQQAAVQRVKKSIQYPPGTPVSLHEHLVNLLPYEQEEDGEEESMNPEAAASGSVQGGEWVAQARLHSARERLLVRLLPALFLLSSSLMPAARHFPILLRHRHGDMGTRSAFLHDSSSSSSSSGYGSYDTPASDPDPTTSTMPPHLFFARTLFLPIHSPSLCGLAASPSTALHSSPPLAPDARGLSPAPDAVWLALRGLHLLPPQGLPILSPDWTPRIPASLQDGSPELSPDGSPEVSPGVSPHLVVGQSLPEDWVVVVSVVWSAHVMEGGGGGEGVRETEAALHVIIAMLKELFSDSRVMVYDEHLPLHQARALFSRAILLVGPTSPALSHLLFMPFNATLIELIPYPVTRPLPSLPLSLSLLQPNLKKAPPDPSPAAGQPSAATWHSQLAERLGIRHYLSVCDLSWLDKSTGEQCHVDEVYATVLATLRRNPALLALTGIPPISFPPDTFLLDTNTTTSTSPSSCCSSSSSGASFSFLYADISSSFVDFRDFIPGSRLQKGAGQVVEFRRWAACVAERGEWRFNATPRLLPWMERGFDNCDLYHVRENGGLAGAPADAVALDRELSREEREKAWKVRDVLKYQWVVPADRCPRVVGAKPGALAQAVPGSEVPGPDELFSRFDGRALCELAGRRRDGLSVAFIGDSLTREAHISFVHSIVTHMPKPSSVITREDGAVWVGQLSRTKSHYYTRASYRFDEAGCPNLQVHYVANRRLVMVGEEKRERVKWISTPWMESSEVRGAHVVVLNRGAHFKPTDHVVLSVSRALQFLRYNYPEKLLVYRATAPGHLNCKDAAGPISKRQNASDLPYHWGEFKAQNEAVRPIVEGMGGVFMDVDPLSALRPDGHRGFVEKMDCLHYCLPGPEDAWSEFLYNIIQRLVPV